MALLLPPRVADEVDGLRRAFGADIGYIPPHITIVPPVNLSDDAVIAALATMRAAAASVDGLELELGPFDTFLPTNPVLFLSVGGDVDSLAKLRVACNSGPLEREESRPFVPHVTVTRGLRPDDDAAVRRLLPDYRVSVSIDRLHMLVQVVTDERGRHWVSTADVELAPRHTIGAGGMQIDMAVSEQADPEVRRVLAEHDVSAPADQGAAVCCVVTCRHQDHVVGVAWARVAGPAATLGDVFIPDDWRRLGIGSHLLATLEHRLARRGVAVVEAPSQVSSAGFGLLRDRGWTERPGSGGSRLWRALGPDGWS